MNKLSTLALAIVAAFSISCASVGGLVHDLAPVVEGAGTDLGLSVSVDPGSLVDSVVICVPPDSVLTGIPFLGEVIVSVIGSCPEIVTPFN